MKENGENRDDYLGVCVLSCECGSAFCDIGACVLGGLCLGILID